MRCKFYSLIALLSIVLAGCSGLPTTSGVNVGSLEATAAAALERGDYIVARDNYRTLVDMTSTNQQQLMLIGLARAELGIGDPQAALATLSRMLPPLPTDIALAESGLRAEALFGIGRTADAVQLLVERDLLLDSNEAIIANQALIWDGLMSPASRVSAMTTRTGDPIVDGWLALAPLTILETDSNEFLAELATWRAQYGNHPAANGILAGFSMPIRASGARPGRIALLLPVGSASPFSPQARAVRDGFMAAHFASGDLGTTSITIYDTSVLGSAESYREALREGADFIVGPLISDEIPQVLAQAGFVPTLALNVGAGESVAAPQFYQFALSSDDEISAVAARAIANGHETAVVLHTNSNFGYDVRDSFRTAFEAHGGRVVATNIYFGGSSNLSTPIEELLNVSRSEARFTRLNNIISGRSIQEFQPRRRGDVDMIFLQIDEPSVARQLVPLLEAYTANEIPTYSTRDAYDPVRQAGSSDLDGLLFPDLPLLLQPVGDARIASEALGDYSNEYSEQFPREFAFGFDAYRLAQALYAQADTRWPLAGATGELHLGTNGRIRRVLPIAEFSGGQPRVVQ